MPNGIPGSTSFLWVALDGNSQKSFPAGIMSITLITTPLVVSVAPTHGPHNGGNIITILGTLSDAMNTYTPSPFVVVCVCVYFFFFFFFFFFVVVVVPVCVSITHTSFSSLG